MRFLCLSKEAMKAAKISDQWLQPQTEQQSQHLLQKVNLLNKKNVGT